MSKPNLKVVVHFIGAGKPFQDDSADPSETVGSLKARVLNAFGLVEGNDPAGNAVSYFLQKDRTRLENPSQTLGELAEGHPVLNLKLEKVVVQG